MNPIICDPDSLAEQSGQRPVTYDGEHWYPVVGVQLRHDGSQIGRRELLVSGRRLPAR